MSRFELQSSFNKDFYNLARNIHTAGYKNEARSIMRLSSQPQVVVDILKKTFIHDLGEALSTERANNLSMLILYYEPGDTDVHEYIHDALMKTNESFYDEERKKKISDQKAWALADKAVTQLQKKNLLPKELN